MFQRNPSINTEAHINERYGMGGSVKKVSTNNRSRVVRQLAKTHLSNRVVPNLQNDY